jgi:hypothetical protein
MDHRKRQAMAKPAVDVQHGVAPTRITVSNPAIKKADAVPCRGPHA